MNSKEEILDNILMADHFILKKFPNLTNLEIIITGGASFLLKGFKNKVTYDIDSISKLEQDVLEYLNSFSINNDAIEVTKIHPSYRDRLEEFKVPLKVIKVFLLGNEDLILTKIGRLSYDDVQDILHSGILNKVDLDLLIKLGNEMSYNDPDFKYNWESFERSGYFDR